MASLSFCPVVKAPHRQAATAGGTPFASLTPAPPIVICIIAAR